MSKQNFLLGKGERLTDDIVIKGGGGPKRTTLHIRRSTKSAVTYGFGNII